MQHPLFMSLARYRIISKSSPFNDSHNIEKKCLLIRGDFWPPKKDGKRFKFRKIEEFKYQAGSLFPNNLIKMKKKLK